ncbi:DUF1059 domain-containing protein [Chloroflexota bacterium]
MAYTLACRDAGLSCDFVAKGDTEEQVLAEGIKHVKAVHGLMDKQIADPEFIAENKQLKKRCSIFIAY